MATINAPQYNSKVRAPVDIVAVIDKSGSMGGRKLNLVKEALNHMIDQCEFTTLSTYSLQIGIIGI